MSAMIITTLETCKDFVVKSVFNKETYDRKLYFYRLLDYDNDQAPTCVEFIKHPETLELWVLFATPRGEIYAVKNPDQGNALQYFPKDAHKIMPDGIIGCCASQDNDKVIIWGKNELQVINAHDFFDHPYEACADSLRITYTNKNKKKIWSLRNDHSINNAFFCSAYVGPHKEKRFLFVIAQNTSGQHFLIVNRFEKQVSYPNSSEEEAWSFFPFSRPPVESCSANGDLIVRLGDNSLCKTFIHSYYQVTTDSFTHDVINQPDNDDQFSIQALSPTVGECEEPTILSNNALYVVNSTIHGDRMLKALEFERPLDDHDIKKFRATGFNSFGGTGAAFILQGQKLSIIGYGRSELESLGIPFDTSPFWKKDFILMLHKTTFE